MATKAEEAFEKWKAAEGQPEGTGEWFEIDQDRIDAFADTTIDHQFIHVDPEQCKALSPWGVPIAHGFLTLSMLTHLMSSVPKDAARYDGIVMGVNYGFEKVRFVNPVKVGSRIRASSVLSKVELKDPQTINTTSTITVEIDGEAKPALVAEWITRLVYG
ncbi:MAG: MaoC family dehydratase [Ilumatobacter sp.]|nr:MaoC family dehydratase [Ilumatobacter sp.]